ncbi:hypothetical protein [Anaeromusa sp.]|uniref:hypothetical protein n=1 Tax=Anaeromusa sp. TaxID=1872520 RepID=UPI0026045676|nr:hypothetical protein [Anaeromusa sp.]MDD3158015.1 hypothetical protein [Anaeromusa sp.]
MCKSCGCFSLGTSQLKLLIKDLDAQQAQEVETFLLGIPGIKHVHIHADNGKATIHYLTKQLSQDTIIQLLKDYHPQKAKTFLGKWW